MVFPSAHWTQVSVNPSHTGVRPLHAVESVVVHCTQDPDVASHAGVPPVHSLVLVALHWTHVSLALSHAGVGSEHCVSEVHSTHAPDPPPSPLHTSPLAHG